MLFFANSDGWWLKYVAAPMIAGSGLIAVIVLMWPHAGAGSSFHAAAASAAAAKASSAPQVDPGPASRPEAEPAPVSDLSTPLPASLPPQQPGEQRNRERIRAALFATDRRGHRFRGSQVSILNGAPIRIHWRIDPKSVTGKIHLRSERNGRTLSDTVVEPEGFRPFQPGSSTTLVLTEVRPGGEKFLADLDIAVRN